MSIDQLELRKLIEQRWDHIERRNLYSLDPNARPRRIEKHMIEILQKYDGNLEGLKTWYTSPTTYPGRNRCTEQLILPDDAACPIFNNLIKKKICRVILNPNAEITMDQKLEYHKQLSCQCKIKILKITLLPITICNLV